MTQEPPDYQSYLLRLYPVRTASGTACRATLQSTQTEERVGFASLWDAFAFLERRMGEALSDPCESYETLARG